MRISGLFLQYLLPQWAFLVLLGVKAWNEGYWTMAQARASEPDPEKAVAALNQHGGYWGSFALAIVIAGMISSGSNHWTARVVVATGFFWATVFSLGPLNYWAKASLKLSEALARYGLPSIPGTMNAMFGVFCLTVLTLYYFFTPKENPDGVWLITGALMAFVLAGVVLPSFVTYGKLRLDAGLFAGGLLVLLFVLAWYRLNIA